MTSYTFFFFFLYPFLFISTSLFVTTAKRSEGENSNSLRFAAHQSLNARIFGIACACVLASGITNLHLFAVVHFVSLFQQCNLGHS